MEQEANQLLQLFHKLEIHYELYEHELVYTSEQASKVRNVELKTGVKSMLVRTDEGKFVLVNLAANRKVDFNVLKSILGSKRVALASKEEVLKITRCEPGSMHPIGRVLGIAETFLDKSVLENDPVNFNIGLLTKSVQISLKDLLKAMNPTAILEFSRI